MPARAVARGRRRPLGTAYRTWLKAQPDGFTGQVEQAALDPFRGYANAIRDELPDAAAILDAFHVVRLGTQVVGEVRRRVQQDTVGHRGHKDDPLYKIRGLLCHGVEHLAAKQQAKIIACLDAGDSDGEVNLPGSAICRRGGGAERDHLVRLGQGHRRHPRVTAVQHHELLNRR